MKRPSTPFNPPAPFVIQAKAAVKVPPVFRPTANPQVPLAPIQRKVSPYFPPSAELGRQNSFTSPAAASPKGDGIQTRVVQKMLVRTGRSFLHSGRTLATRAPRGGVIAAPLQSVEKNVPIESNWKIGPGPSADYVRKHGVNNALFAIAARNTIANESVELNDNEEESFTSDTKLVSFVIYPNGLFNPASQKAKWIAPSGKITRATYKNGVASTPPMGTAVTEGNIIGGSRINGDPGYMYVKDWHHLEGVGDIFSIADKLLSSKDDYIRETLKILWATLTSSEQKKILHEWKKKREYERKFGRNGRQLVVLESELERKVRLKKMSQLILWNEGQL